MICSSLNLLFFMSVLPWKTDSTNLQVARHTGGRSDTSLLGFCAGVERDDWRLKKVLHCATPTCGPYPLWFPNLYIFWRQNGRNGCERRFWAADALFRVGAKNSRWAPPKWQPLKQYRSSTRDGPLLFL